jgi:hypothetical protein
LFLSTSSSKKTCNTTDRCKLSCSLNFAGYIYRLGSKVCPILLKTRWTSAYRSTSLRVVKIIRCLYRTENNMGVMFDVTSSQQTGNNSLSWRIFFWNKSSNRPSQENKQLDDSVKTDKPV